MAARALLDPEREANLVHGQHGRTGHRDGGSMQRQKERLGLGNSRPDYFGGEIHDGAWGEPQRRSWL